MKKQSLPILPYVIFSIILSFILWSYLILSRYDVQSYRVFFLTLRYAFSANLWRLSLGSVFGGFALGGLATFFYLKAPPIRRKTKGLIRGSELYSAKNLAKLTQSRDYHQVSLADVPIPIDLEPLHFLIAGSTGGGKSVAITEMLRQIIPRGDRVIVTDPNGESLSRFWQKGDVILNPFDRRGEGWNLYTEFRADYDYERYAKSVIPPATSSSDAEWHRYAQQLFSETAKVLRRRNQGTMKDLSRWLIDEPDEELGKLLKNTSASGLFHPGAVKALASTRFIVTNYVAPYQYIKPGNFSLRDWLADENGGNLYVTWREDMADVLRPLISTWLDILCTSVLSLPPSRARRIWIIIDELASLERLNSLESALTKGRKHGLRVVAGLQSTKQLDDLYGHNKGVVLRSCFGNLLILRGGASDPDTAEVLSRGLGEREMERKQKSTTRNRQGLNRTETVQRVKERLVFPSEIMQLPKLEGYLSLAENHPIGKVKLSLPKLKAEVPAFEEFED